MTNPAKLTAKQVLRRAKTLTRENAVNRLEFSELVYRLKLDVEFQRSLKCETFEVFASTHLQMSYDKALQHIALWEHFGINLAGHFNPANPPAWSILRVMMRFTDAQNIRHWWKRARTMSYAEAMGVAGEKKVQLLGGRGCDSLV